MDVAAASGKYFLMSVTDAIKTAQVNLNCVAMLSCLLDAVHGAGNNQWWPWPAHQTKQGKKRKCSFAICALL
jgi:hypothetical protein